MAQALEAAHLVPARNGENDMPFNGIALRADLHALFDGSLCTFRENGRVALAAPSSRLSAAYRRLLRNKRLLAEALDQCLQASQTERVATTG